MKLKQVFPILVLCSLFISAYARNDTIPRPLKVGDQVPNIFIPHISNYSKSSAHFSEFKGKLVILDFWATFCKPCIAALPKMDSLQKQFEGEVQILLVNTSSQEELDSLFELNSKLRRIGTDLKSLVERFVSVTGDTVFNDLFPHTGIPHYVWISPEGRVGAVTSGQEITALNIRAALDNRDFSVAQKVDIRLVPSKSILLQLSDIDTTTVRYYSSIMEYVPNLGGTIPPSFSIDSTAKTVKIVRFSSILGSLESIYSDFGFGSPYRNPIFDYGKRVILQTADSSRFFYESSSGISREEWSRRNKFIYEAVLPVMSRDEADTYFMEDIERYFQIDTRMVKRKKKCLSLVRTSNKDKMAHDGGKVEFVVYYEDDGTFHLNGGFMETFRQELSQANKSTPYLFLDETGYKGRIELELDSPLDNIATLRKELRKKYDLDLIEVTREVDMLIVRDMRGVAK